MKSIKSALITTLLLIGGSANAAFINFTDESGRVTPGKPYGMGG